MNPLEPHLPVLQVVVPLLAAPLVMLLRDRSLAWAAATATSMCAFAVAIVLTGIVRSSGPLSYALGSWPAPYGIELVVDSLAALLLLIVTGASTAALLIARHSLDREVSESSQHLFYAAWLLAVAGLSGIVVAGDAFNIFVFMEISSLATYILIAGGPRRRALTAVFKYLIMGTIGATFYLIGVGLIYMMTGTLNLADMAARLGDVQDVKPLLVAGGFITVGLALKAALFPLHSWLPSAYSCAPHVATAFIAACSTKVALYVLLRFDFVVLQGNLAGHEAQFTLFILPLAILAIVAASALALLERDVKRLLAYSSVAQIGYILFGASLASAAGLTAGIVHMFNHALAKGTLFMAVACLGMRIGSVISLDSIAGVARRMPLTMAAFVVAGLSLIGIPGTAGFIGKWQLLVAALERGAAGAWLMLPVLLSSLLAVVYVWRVLESAYFARAAPAGDGGEAPRWMLLVLWVTVIANVYFGLAPSLPLALAEDAAASLMARPR